MLHIVTHCYAAELPQYAALLRYQLASLVIHRPVHETWITVCYMNGDERVDAVLDDFVGCSDINLIALRMTRDQISRRAIGRNMAALSSQAELIWFADCDYVFGPGCIDGLVSAWESLDEWTPMIWPARYWIHSSHLAGDRAIDTACSWPAGGTNYRLLPDIDPREFTPARFTRAIGGVQICPGSFCRVHGYLDGRRKYQTPLKRPFSNFRDDVAWRRFCNRHGRQRVVDFPHLYRIRHSRKSYG